MSKRPIIAALGDSLTVGEHADGTPLHNHPWPEYLDAKLFPYAGVGQFGLGGDTISGMQTRYDSFIKDNGFTWLILWGGVNDIVQDHTAVATWAQMEALIDGAIDDGLQVIMALTPGFGAYSGWSAPRQAQLDALRLLMKAKTGVTQVDLYQPYPVGMNDPTTPNRIYIPFAYSDFLHINPTGALYLGHTIFYSALAGTVVPVTEAVP